MSYIIFVCLLVATLLSSGSCGSYLHIHPDNIGAQLLPQYDYIVVGGGVAGLVIANRLSDGHNVTVLVLEAGSLDTEGETVTIPALIGRDLWTKYDWNFSTTAQTSLNNGKRAVNSGRAVGGSSILNGLVWTRGSASDYDAWEALGNPGWAGKTSFLTSCGETFIPRQYNVSSRHPQPVVPGHGSDGPVQVAYPNFLYEQSNNFLQGVASLGVPILEDQNKGVGAGASIVPSSMHWLNQSRADARMAYLQYGHAEGDRVSNPHIATEQTVTRILIEKDNATSSGPVPPFGYPRRAFGVEFASTTGNIRRNITCSKEVILAAGALLSPALLQVSGIGPAELLQSINVTVQVDLPGVGQNFQDHPMVGAFYNYSNSSIFRASNLTGANLRAAHDLYYTNRTGPWIAPLISTLGFPPLHLLTPNSTSLLSQATAFPAAHYLSDETRQHPTVVAGYTVQAADPTLPPRAARHRRLGDTS